MSQVKTELWMRIVGKFVECSAELPPSVDNMNELGDYLAVYTTELGADVCTVDVRVAEQSADVLALLAKRLHFPDYFGQNLDALYDVVGEYADNFQTQLDAQAGSVPQVWLIHSRVSQEKMLFPVMDTLRDALSDVSGVGLSILWVISAN